MQQEEEVDHLPRPRQVGLEVVQQHPKSPCPQWLVERDLGDHELQHALWSNLLQLSAASVCRLRKGSKALHLQRLEAALEPPARLGLCCCGSKLILLELDRHRSRCLVYSPLLCPLHPIGSSAGSRQHGLRLQPGLAMVGFSEELPSSGLRSARTASTPSWHCDASPQCADSARNLPPPVLPPPHRVQKGWHLEPWEHGHIPTDMVKHLICAPCCSLQSKPCWQSVASPPGLWPQTGSPSAS